MHRRQGPAAHCRPLSQSTGALGTQAEMGALACSGSRNKHHRLGLEWIEPLMFRGLED